MKQTATLIMPGGQTTTELPDNFKELQTGVSPIRVLYTNAGFSRPLPCSVMTKRSIERLYSKFSYGTLCSYFRYEVVNLPVWIEQNAGVWSINIIFQAWQDITFLVDFYGFLENPENEDDTNFFLSNYEQMCMAKAKAIAWEEINDDIAEQAENLFDKEFRESAFDDAYRAVRGVETRM